MGDMGYGIWDMGYGIWDMGYGIWGVYVSRNDIPGKCLSEFSFSAQR
jgi:hypothetical protein